MKLGTKSVLFGAHCFFLHPFFVARAWWILYGFPYDPRLWFAFFLHDIGYIGKAKMDDADGETHPEVGARIMRFLFGDTWGDFCLLHSRYYAKRLDRPFSLLCVADKLSFCLTPKWLYLPMVRATTELQEYLNNATPIKCDGSQFQSAYYTTKFSGPNNAGIWWDNLADYMKRWVDAHKDGEQDTWTRKRHSEISNPSTANVSIVGSSSV